MRWSPSPSYEWFHRAVAVSIAVLAASVAASMAVADESAAQGSEGTSGSPASTRLRLISLNPSLTAIVLRLGAGDSLVGVDDYSAQVLPEVRDLDRVGGLFDPSLEAVVALQPDRVLLVAGVGQQSYGERLAKLGFEVDVYRNEAMAEVLENIERLGSLLGREPIARQRIREIKEIRAAIETAVGPRAHPKTIAIVDRSPLYLVGAGTFLDEMLAIVGARNLGRTLAEGYPRGSIEWLIAQRPELLLDMTPNAEEAGAFWGRWPSLPAVAQGRVLTLESSSVSLPGPDLDRALLILAAAVHGPEVRGEIDDLLRTKRGAKASRGTADVESGAGKGPHADEVGP